VLIQWKSGQRVRISPSSLAQRVFFSNKIGLQLGNFSKVQISGTDRPECYSVVEGPTALSLLFSPSRCAQSPSASPNSSPDGTPNTPSDALIGDDQMPAIAGGIIGGVVGLVLVFLLVAYLVPPFRRKLFPSCVGTAARKIDHLQAQRLSDAISTLENAPAKEIRTWTSTSKPNSIRNTTDRWGNSQVMETS